jgi:hypothetical protein
MLSLMHPHKKKPTESSGERGGHMIGPPQPINVLGKCSTNYPLGGKAGRGAVALKLHALYKIKG